MSSTAAWAGGTHELAQNHPSATKLVLVTLKILYQKGQMLSLRKGHGGWGAENRRGGGTFGARGGGGVLRVTRAACRIASQRPNTSFLDVTLPRESLCHACTRRRLAPVPMNNNVKFCSHHVAITGFTAHKLRLPSLWRHTVADDCPFLSIRTGDSTLG